MMSLDSVYGPMMDGEEFAKDLVKDSKFNFTKNVKQRGVMVRPAVA